uniref:coiled-coil domain-containing protein 187 isoform X2 n=1 Tax=Jaculus jaculus TaxID=51337 RepID=UPI001E1B5588|nr:coiled-coil domain-containing protein 187 isoform X2 [Jaculus jaculus]
MWSAGLDTRNGDSSVSSGRLSGSSGGHESGALPHGPWKERPPQVLEPQQQPRRRDPRLEQLRDKIRAQARWKTSCASLGTSVPSSASCFGKTSPAVLRRKTPRAAKALPAPAHSGMLSTVECRGEDREPPSLGRELSRISQHQTSAARANTKRSKSASCKREKALQSPTPGRAAKCRDSELAGVYAWRKGRALVRQLLGPPPTLPRLPSKAPGVELGADKIAAIAGTSSAHTWLPKPSCAHSDRHTPNLVSQEQPATIQTAMAILQDLRKQIQAGLELARRPRAGRKPIPSKPKPQSLAEKGQQGPQSTQGMQSSLLKSDKVVTGGKYPTLDKAGGLGTQQPWNTLAEQQSCTQRIWAGQGRDTSFQMPGTPPEKLSSSQRPWSSLAGLIYPHKVWTPHGRDSSFQRPDSPPEKLSSFSQRPWSALAGQAGRQRAWEAYDDWKVPGPSLWPTLERPCPTLQRPRSTSFVQRSSPHCKGSSANPPPSRAKQAWVRPAQGFSQNPPGEEQDTQQSPPCPRLRRALGHQYSSESLRDFMRQKAQARQRQALEQKAVAARTQQLRNQRLQEVYRKQREAVLGKPDPVVSQRRPGIVTFVPSSAQSGGLETPESLKSPVQEWSKVTSGVVVGDQEAPASFCLCLNRAWNHTETLDTSGHPDGYKQARLQALETMADVLKKRIDLLTAKLRRSVSLDEAGDLAPDMLPLSSTSVSTIPTFAASTCPRALVPNGDREMPQDPRDWEDLQAKPFPTTYLLDGETLPWSPSWKPRSLSAAPHFHSQLQGSHIPSKGVMKDRVWELEKRWKREAAALRTLSTCTKSSLETPLAAPDPTLDSLWLEEMPEARGAGLVTPRTTLSCDLGQQALATLGPSDGLPHQRRATKPGPGPGAGASVAFYRFTVAMLEQRRREEEQRAQHQAALLRLRELALEEKARAELAWLEHQRGCLGNKGHKAMQAILLERQQQVLSKLEKEWREIKHLKKAHSTLHYGRLQLLQHQQAILEVQRSTACLRQELQLKKTQLSQSLSPRVRTAWERSSEKSQQLKGTLYPMAPHGLGRPSSHCPQSSSGGSEVTRLPSQQQERTSPWKTLDAHKRLQSPRVTWGDDTPETGSALAERSHVDREPEKHPRVPVLGPLRSSSPDFSGQRLDPAFPVAPAPLGVPPPVVLMQATKEEGSPTAPLRLREAKELPTGDPLMKSSAASAGKRHLASTDSNAWSLQGQPRPSPQGESPCSQEARQVAEGITSQEGLESGLGVAGSPEEKPWEEASWRRQACQQEEPDVPLIQVEPTQLAASPAAPEEEMPPVLCPSNPQSAAPLGLSSDSASSICSGSSEAPESSPASSMGLENSLSCSSLQEFQKATATLVQLSDSSPSSFSLEAEVTPDVNPRWSGELVTDISREESGPPSSWGLHLGHPRLGGVPRNVGQVTWQRMSGSSAGSLYDSSEVVAVAGSPEPGHSLLGVGWPLSLPDAPTPRLGSELSETSSRIWDEDGEENLLEPGPHVDPASGSSLPADGVSNLESSGEPCVVHPSTDPREDQEVSRTSRNLASVSNTGQTKQVSPEAPCTTLPSQTPSTSDLDLSLSLPSDTSTSEVAGVSKGDMTAQTSAGFQERSQDANPSLSVERNPLQTLLEPKAPISLPFPPRVPPGAKCQEAGSEEDRALFVEAASPQGVSGFLTEILSPVDEELSYGSGDLPSSTHRHTHLPPLPPTPQAKSDTNKPSLSSEDFPSPPEEAMFPGSSLGDLGEDTCVTTEDISSLSEEAPAAALSPRPQESGLCLRASGQAGNLGDRQGDSKSMVMSQDEGRQCSEPDVWPASPLSKGVGSALGQPPSPSAQPSTVSLAARCGQSMPLEASDTDVLLRTQWGPWKGVQCFEGAECQQETGHILDIQAATPSPTCPEVPKGPPPGQVPLVASGKVGTFGHTSEEEEEEGVLSLDSLDREQLPERDRAAVLASGGCANLPSPGGAGPVDVVSTQLSRKILCDSMAALSAIVPGGSP